MSVWMSAQSLGSSFAVGSGRASNSWRSSSARVRSEGGCTCVRDLRCATGCTPARRDRLGVTSLSTRLPQFVADEIFGLYPGYSHEIQFPAGCIKAENTL